MRLSIRSCGLPFALIALLWAGLGPLLHAQPTKIRVTAWNMGNLGETTTEKAAQALDQFSEQADILALQECPAPSSNATRLAWNGVFEYSNAILSRWPIIASGLVPANPSWPRDLPWADIQPPSGPAVRIYSVHLTFRRGGTPFLATAREIETRRILTHANGFSGPVIVAGDFNSVGWFLGGQASEPAIRLLQLTQYNDALAMIGGRTHAILGRLDWIFSRGLTASEPVLGEYAGSDHRWISTTFAPDEGERQQMPPSGSSNGFVQSAAAIGVLALAVWWRRRTR